MNIPDGNWIPTGNRVFVAPEIEEKEGSIWLSRGSRQMPSVGIVKAISRAVTVNGKPIEFKVGDRVVFNKHYQELSEDHRIVVIDAKYIEAVLG